MKAFLASVVAAVTISLASAVILTMVDFSAESANQSQNGTVRLDPAK